MPLQALTAPGLCLLAASIAGLLLAVDTIAAHREWGAAMRTREWALWWLANVAVAFVGIYVLYSQRKLELSFLGLVTVIAGYPLLLTGRVGTMPADGKAVSLDAALQAVRKMLVPRIDDSIKEQKLRVLRQWHRSDFGRLVAAAQDYLALPRTASSDAARKRTAEVSRWLAELDAVTGSDEALRGRNTRTMFVQFDELGGLRAVQWILRNSR